MSTLYYMACHDCHEFIWIGQDGLSGRTFYSHEPRGMKAFRGFLFRHAQHRLEFTSEHNENLDRDRDQPWTEIEWSRGSDAPPADSGREP